MNIGHAVLFILLAGFSSCQWQNKNVEENKPTLKDNRLSDTDVKGFLKTLESSDCVYGPVVGIDGQESIVYNCFRQLDSALSDSAWLNLTNSPVPVLRMYAYQALENRNSRLTLLARNRLIDDTAMVCHISNDLTLTYSIGQYVSLELSSDKNAVE